MKPKKPPYIWVVEMFNEDMKRFEPTVGASLSREDGRADLAGWKRRNCARFRLWKYARIEP